MRQLLLLVVVVSMLCTDTTAGKPFRVYQQCVTPNGVVGQCRGEPETRTQLASTDLTTAATQYPIDMSLPCAGERKCTEVCSGRLKFFS